MKQAYASLDKQGNQFTKFYDIFEIDNYVSLLFEMMYILHKKIEH
mgnify:CR=1 FL=1